MLNKLEDRSKKFIIELSTSDYLDVIYLNNLKYVSIYKICNNSISNS